MFEKRVKSLVSLSLVFTILLMGKIAYICTFRHESYTKEVIAQQTVTKKVASVRGPIFDRNAIALVDRKDEFFYIDKNGNPSKDGGVISFGSTTASPSGEVGAHILGYTSVDGTGLCAIEKKYDKVLKGDLCHLVTYMQDASGSPLAHGKVSYKKEENGNINGLGLCIDYHIQKQCEEILKRYIKKGACVVLDAKSFDILAMASVPTYDRENVSQTLTSDNGELLNRALCAYNAGSVFKIVTASCALEKIPYYEDRLFFCDGMFEQDTKTYACHKKDGHMTQTFHEAFANSCNCAFYETSLLVGSKTITDMAKKFGLGEKILHFGKEESAGYIERADNAPANHAINLGIGQGKTLITPLQCAAMAATIANGGERKEVNLANRITDKYANIKKDISKTSSIRVIKKSTADKIGSMMRSCVTDGTAKSISSSPLEIAGKTGSAETGWKNTDGEYMVHGWFCGFFPYSDPKYAIAVFCEDGKSGTQSCVEPFLKICEKIDEFYPVKQ